MGGSVVQVTERAIPKWVENLGSLAVMMPLKQRKQLLKATMNKLSDEQLAAMVKDDNVFGARFLSHFLTGEGKPLKLDLTDKQWKILLKTPGTKTTGPEWTPSTNPKFPASKGWEYKQVRLSERKERITDAGIMKELWVRPLGNKIHNVLGTVTTVRRKAVPGGHEYQIAEDFDLMAGQKGLLGGLKYYTGPRKIPSEAVRLINKVFPEYLSEDTQWKLGFTERKYRQAIKGDHKAAYKRLRKEEIADTARDPITVSAAKDLGPAGTPFPIQSTYFQADDKNVKVKPYKSYLTKLNTGDEQEFQVWFDRYVREVHGPLIRMNPDEKEQYYDYRGYWIDNRREAGKPMKRGQHLTDKYKIPGHHSFSIESKYYQPGMEKNTKVIQWINNKPVRIGSQ